MKTLIIYDTLYGNTEKIARAIAAAINGEIKILRVGEIASPELKTYDLLIIGSPTQGGRPTLAIQDFVKQVAILDMQSTRFAAFDTRLSNKLVGVFGYAAGKIVESLKKGGLTLIGQPQGFFVKGTKGELENGEIEHAASWAKEMVNKLK